MMKAGITKMATKSRYEAYAKSMKEKKDIKRTIKLLRRIILKSPSFEPRAISFTQSRVTATVIPDEAKVASKV